MSKTLYLFMLAVVMTVGSVVANAAGTLVITVTGSDTKEPIEFASVILTPGEGNSAKPTGQATNVDGQCFFNLAPGNWAVKVSYIGYTPYEQSVKIANGKTENLAVTITPQGHALEEVVVTAREAQGFTSASKIGREAMSHLQPSGFSELLELLPGGKSSDPETSSVNLANLRSAADNPSDAYATSSLGVGFVVDGVPMNTSADMIISSDASRASRSSAGKGVDMRSLSTDDIESVEIVRGIASAEYGETTSGLINIKRKNRGNTFEARFKADQQSTLFYLGKGFTATPDWTINISADYLDSKADPRNNRENFKRVTASGRSIYQNKSANWLTTWTSSIDYTGTFERDRNDPDLTVNGTIDYYTSDRNRLSWNNLLTLARSEGSFFRDLSVTTGLSYGWEHLYQQKTVAGSRVYPMPVSITPGPNYVGFLPMLYLADYDIYSRPLTAFVKANAHMYYSIGTVGNNLKAGAEWSLSKNYGKGPTYDLMRPLTAGNNTRPRAYSDVPAIDQVAMYVENVSNIQFGNNNIELQLGLRASMLTNLDSRYYLANRLYLDPRINLHWQFPSITIAERPLRPSIAGGIGWHSKMPGATHLFPEKIYTDWVQLNYFHNVEAYRTMNVMTYVDDVTNYDLKAARNLKWEVRADLEYRGNILSLTYFREDMKDGFRQAVTPVTYNYRRYDASAFDPFVVDRAPVIDELPYTDVARLSTLSRTTNDSRILKEGIEYSFSSLRIPYIRTRVTVSGAYFRTTLSNSQALWYRPTVVINGEEYPYAGLYPDPDGIRYTTFNTNIMLDTDIPVLKLNFSITAQNEWFSTQQTLFRTGIPTHYIDLNGVIRPYTLEMMTDPYLQHLVRKYTNTAFDERRIPAATNFNIKATKKLWNDRIAIAIYVNRLLSITPDYHQYGVLIRRYSSPYFGMELNFRF